jgi:hypothetical protein
MGVFPERAKPPSSSAMASAPEHLNVRTIWDIGDKKPEVDTHPILGSGRNGRIWLFQEVTARSIGSTRICVRWR